MKKVAQLFYKYYIYLTGITTGMVAGYICRFYTGFNKGAYPLKLNPYPGIFPEAVSCLYIAVLLKQVKSKYNE